MKAYSLGLRIKIVESARRGISKSETARRFGVNRSTAKRYLNQLDEEGSLAPKKAPGKSPKLDERDMRLLEEDLEVRPWVTHSQRREFLFRVCGGESHKGQRVRESIEGRDRELLFLPPYSQDYNQIEEAFSKIKVLLRKAEARTREALIETLGATISAITSQDVRGFFEHCGYQRVGQQLWRML